MKETKSQRGVLDLYSGKHGGALFIVASHSMKSDGIMVITLKGYGSYNVSRRGKVTACQTNP